MTAAVEGKVRKFWTVTLVAQTTVSFFAIATVNYFLTITDVVSEGGMQSVSILLGWIVTPILTNWIVLLIGLPLRIGRRASWWHEHTLLALVGTLLGILLIVLSWFPLGATTVDLDSLGHPQNLFAPYGWTLLGGWFLLAFSITHTWLPYRWSSAQRFGPEPLPSAE